MRKKNMQIILFYFWNIVFLSYTRLKIKLAFIVQMKVLFRNVLLNHILNMRRMSEKIKLFRHKPLVIIYGCTGTGKTKLSVELAKKYGEKAEIINADAMQVLN